VHRRVSPDSALEDLESALAAAPEEDHPLRCELAAEIVQTELQRGQKTEAVRRGQELLELVKGQESVVELSMLELSVGLALLEAKGPIAESRRLLQSGLGRVRGVDRYNGATARLHLVRFGLAAGDRELIEEHLAVFRDQKARLAGTLLVDAARLEVEFLIAFGVTAFPTLLDDARRAARGTRRQPLLELEHLRLCLALGETVDPVDAVVAALDAPRDAELDRLLLQVVCAHGEGLPHQVLRRALAVVPGDSRPSDRARILVHLGETPEAIALLRESLRGSTAGGTRLACTHLLVCLLSPGAGRERLEACSTLENLLEEVEDIPHVRIDLAEALRLAADGDESILRRALAHAERAAEGLAVGVEERQGRRVRALLLNDLALACCTRSSFEQAEEARWLLEDHPLPSETLGAIRHAVAHNLLVPGKLAHPDAIEVAALLVSLAERDLGPVEKVMAVADRLDAVRGSTSSLLRSEEVLQGLDEHIPTWIVDVVRGPGRDVSPDELARHLEPLQAALYVRSDTADRVLAQLLPLQARMSSGGRAAFLHLVEAAVQREGHGVWPALSRAIEATRKKDRNSRLEAIARQLRRARGDDRVEPPPPTTRMDPEEAWDRGVELMRLVQADPHHEEAEARIAEARRLLAGAVKRAKNKWRSHRASFLISLGNAWKIPPNEDLDRALRIYAKVARMNLHPDQEGQLWKVQGDALRLRGTPKDLRRALPLLERAARRREGWTRAEALVAAARVAREHPDFDDDARVIRAAELLMDATAADAGHVSHAMSLLVMLLWDWQGRRPDDQRPRRLRATLKRRYPDRTAEIDRPATPPPASIGEKLVRELEHPAAAAMMDVLHRLRSPAQILQGMTDFGGQFGPSVEAAVRETALRESLYDDIEGKERLLGELDAHVGDEEAPGIAVAKVALLAALTRHGRRRVEEVRKATATARGEAGRVEESAVRAALLRELARTWCADDHAADPVRDFSLVVELAEEALKLLDGDLLEDIDVLELLARGLRYSGAGDIQANLRESIRLREIQVEYLRRHWGGDSLANALHCLADAISQLGEGERTARLKEGEQLILEAIAIASPRWKAKYTSSLAWQQTQIALRTPVSEGDAPFRKALATFDRVDTSMLDPHSLRNHEGNRDVCVSSLARLSKGKEAEVAFWRARVKELGEAPPHVLATARHNLANALLHGEEVPLDVVEEGLSLCRLALEVRTLAADARHCWETALLAGGALAPVLAASLDRSTGRLPSSRAKSWREARSWLQLAIRAGRELGSGSELARAAFTLIGLVRSAPSLGQAVEVGEESWRAVSDAAPLLLFSDSHRLQEAETATQAALEYAYRFAREGLHGVGTDIVFALDGEAAGTVVRWLVRGQAPLRRPLDSRLSKPAEVPHEAWLEWIAAVESRNPMELVRPLRRVRESAPRFLGSDPSLEATWRWLASRPGSVALSVVHASPVSVAAILRVTTDGRRRTQILGLPLGPPPVDGATLGERLRLAVEEPATAEMTHQGVAEWARAGIAAPTLRFLGEPPTTILWCPARMLRGIAPSSIFPGLPVATTAGLPLPDLTQVAARPRSTLVLLADPDRDPHALGEAGLQAFEHLLAKAQSRGVSTGVASVGDRFGAPLVRGAVNAPASPRAVLARVPEHDLVVAIAHGSAESPESAALLLVDETGATVELDVSALQEHAGRLTGLNVLLLSCEGGRIFDAFHEPGGVAGALISAGARTVVAPLWPVRLDIAEQVAGAILDGMADGAAPWEVLAGLQVSGGDGPVLGPAPSLGVQRAAVQMQRAAFVTWVG